MKTLLLTLCLLSPVTLAAQTVTATYDVQLNGNDSTYMRSLTARHVNGQLRFLTLTHTGTLMEFTLPPAGQKQSTAIRSWNIGAYVHDFTGLWFEEAKNRLWITGAVDYPNGDATVPAVLVTVRLNDDGSVTKLGSLTLPQVPDRRAYGTVQPSPIPGYDYVVGNGGYTSRMACCGGAVLGPTLYAFTEAGGFKVLLDASASRGYRLSLVQNYFDGGDPRQNPSSRPTSPPLASAGWLSPNSAGVGWFVWGDSYYATGMWTGTQFCAVASLAKGSAWYQSSTLAFDGRQFEMHCWQPSQLTGADVLARPTMAALAVSVGNGTVWGGDSPAGNLSGAVYADGSAYVFGCPLGPDVFTCRLYAVSLSGAVPVPAPAPAPTPTPTPTPAPSTSLPSGAVVCAQEDGSCTFSGAARPVYYGAGSMFVSKTLTSPVACGNGTFGDPLVGTAKACYVVPDAAPPVVIPAPPDPSKSVCTVVSKPTFYSNGDVKLTLRCPNLAAPALNGTVTVTR